MKRILVAGASGALGPVILKQLREQGFWTRALVRTPAKMPAIRALADEVVLVDVTRPETLAGVCDGVDAVISCLGATLRFSASKLDTQNFSRSSLLGSVRFWEKGRRDEFRTIDGAGNSAILAAAQKAGVRKLVYVGLFSNAALEGTAVVRAKTEFIRELERSGIDYHVVHPTGMFSVFTELVHMARKGALPKFTEVRTNPIADEEVAQACIEGLTATVRERMIGGPETLTRREIADRIFAALKQPPRYRTMPPLMLDTILFLARHLNPHLHDILRFYIQLALHDAVAPAVGTKRIDDHFRRIAESRPV